MADLKATNISMVSDIGSYEGDALGLVLFLREKVISDLTKLLDGQLIYDSYTESTTIEEVEDEIIFEDGDSEFGESLSEKESEEVFEEGIPIEVIPQKPSEILDVTISSKIDKFNNVIKYYDNVITLDGVVTEEITPSTVIQKFKELDGVYTQYGEFTLSDSLDTV